MVTNNECHTLPRILIVESLAHPFERVGLVCSVTLAPKHGVRFQIAILIVVLATLVFKDKSEFIWRWFELRQFLVKHGGLPRCALECLAFLVDGKFALGFRDKAGVARTDQRQRMAKSGCVLG